MWNRLRLIRFLQVSQIFQRRKSDANKQDFENKLNLTCHAQSTPKTTGILTNVFSTSDPNLVALAWTGDELSRGQTWWRTDGRTDGQTQATTIPGGQYWPWVKSPDYYAQTPGMQFVLRHATISFLYPLFVYIGRGRDHLFIHLFVYLFIYYL